MTRYFYTDPLAAAWMAKHFGMRFYFIDSGGGMCEYAAAITGEDDAWRAEDGRFHIHPECLHLLEPRPRDLVFYGYGVFPHAGEAWDEVRAVIQPHDEQYPTLGDGDPVMLLDGGDYRSIGRLNRIILRDGLAFHWPEVVHG